MMLRWLVLLLVWAGQLFAAEFPKGITLLHFSDIHGHLENFARQVAWTEQIRTENTAADKLTYVLFAGDLFTGTPISSEWQGAVEVEAMNRLEIDGMVVGNHEFDFSLARLLALHKKMDFPVVSANILYKDSGRLLFSPFVLLAKEKVTLGILGLTIPETPVLTHPDNVRALLFSNPIETTKQYITDLKRDDFSIALTHMKESDDKKLLKQFKSIDLVLAGHTHPNPKNEPYCQKIRGRHLCRTPAYGTHVGRIELVKEKGDWQVAATHLIALDKNKAEDLPTKNWLAQYEKAIDQRYGRVIAYAKENLPHHRGGPTPLGQLIARIMQGQTGADVALINSGAISYSLSKGPIRMKDIITILPFNNMPQVLELTGRELRKVLEFSEQRINSGAYLQTAGLDGKKFAPQQKIKVCTVDFLIAGGDGYYHFKDKKILRGYTQTIGEMVAAQLKNQHTVSVAE